MKLSREVKTGILAIGSILLFIFGYSYLQGTNLLANNKSFFVKFDNVEGLSKAAPVTINGLPVGEISDIKFNGREGGLVVEFNIITDLEFSKNSVVRIYSTGLIGGKNLGLFPDYTGDMAASGDTLSGEIQQGMLESLTDRLEPLQEQVNTTLGSLDTVLIAFNEVLNPRTQVNLEETLGRLNTSSRYFTSISKNMDELLKENKEKLSSTITNFDTTSKNFARLSDSLSQVDVGQMVRQLEDLTQKLNDMVTSIDNGEGTVGKLLKDDKMYDNLEAASRQLEELLQDVKLHPKRYVHFSLFGKKDKGYKAPDDPNK